MTYDLTLLNVTNRKILASKSLAIIVTAILMVLGLATLFYLKDLVLIVLTAIVISSSIEPGVLWLMRYRLPRVLSVLAIYVIVLGSFLGGLYFFVPVVTNEASQLIAKLPTNLSAFGVDSIAAEGSQLLGQEGASTVSNLFNGSFSQLVNTVKDMQAAFSDSSEGILRTVTTVFGGIFSFMLIIVLSFYFAMQETGIDDFLRVVSPVKYQAYVLDLWRRSHMKIGLWMQGQLLLSILIGVLVYLGLEIIYQGVGVVDSRYSFLLAIIAAMFELIPVFGSFMAAVPAIAFAFVDGGSTLAIAVLFWYVIVNQFQSNLIYPLVVKKIVGVPPLLVILALIAGAQLAGFLGIIIAVPLAAALQEFVSDIQKKKQRELERLGQGA